MRFLYTCLLRLLAPLMLLRAAWRGRHADPVAPERLAERLGYVSPVDDDERQPLLLHCVSVGETMAALPLIEALLARGEPLWITSTTLTGAARVQSLFGARVRRSFLPLDTPGAVARFLDRVRPRAVLVMETEVWPNLLAACTRRAIPALLVNARMSEKSARGYVRAGSLARDAFAAFTAIAAQTDADALRLAQLAARDIRVTGNLKFDLAPDGSTTERAAQLRDEWGVRPVWIAASTHAEDDAVVLQTHRLLLSAFPELLLVLVPRHPQRFAAVAAQIAAAGFSCARRSRGESVTPAIAVYLADTMGELGMLYAVADVAFVGGTFSGTGGHNFLEPAALGLPVASGPSVYNFQAIADELRQTGALQPVVDSASLARCLRDWLENPAQRQKAGAAGHEFVTANRGALMRTLAVIDPVIV